MNDFQLGEMVLIAEDITGDDPSAAELTNKHGIIHDIFNDYAILTLLNGQKVQVLIKNLRKVTTYD